MEMGWGSALGTAINAESWDITVVQKLHLGRFCCRGGGHDDIFAKACARDSRDGEPK